MTSYSYSLDREVWLGSFKSRSEAAKAGVAHGMREAMPPETIGEGDEQNQADVCPRRGSNPHALAGGRF